MSKYIYFNEIRTDKKTKHFEVTSCSNDCVLGIIKWYSSWRKYCFFPEGETIFSTDCVQVIIEKINKLMDERKKLKPRTTPLPKTEASKRCSNCGKYVYVCKC